MTHTRSGPDRHILDPALLTLLGYSPCNPFNSSYRLSIRQVCACAVAPPLPILFHLTFFLSYRESEDNGRSGDRRPTL